MAARIAIFFAITKVLGADELVVDTELDSTEELLTNSVCLLQKELTLGIQPPGYNGPYVDPNPDKPGYDLWEKRLMNDKIHGDFFKPSPDEEITTTGAHPPPARPRPPLVAPMDSLVSPAPAPVPPLATQEAEDYWQSISWSSALFGVTSLWLVSFTLVSLRQHKGRHSSFRQASCHIIVFFCAKLMFAAIDLFTAASLQNLGWEKAYWLEIPSAPPPKEQLHVSLIRALCMAGVSELVIFLLCWDRFFNEKVVTCASSFAGPLVGFALIDVCQICFRFPEIRGHFESYFGLAAIILLGLVAYLMLRTLFQFDNDDEHYSQAGICFENGFVCLVAGFLLYTVSSIVGEVEAPDSECSWVTWTGILLLVCVFAGTLGRIDQDFNVDVAHHDPSRFSELSQLSLLMGAVWCFLSAFTWGFHIDNKPSTLLQTGFATPPLLFALFASVMVLALVIVVGTSRGPNSPLRAADRTHLHVFLVAGAFAGIAWAICFIHAARDISDLFPLHRHIVEACLCLGLAVFLIPLWSFLAPPYPEETLWDVASGMAKALVEPSEPRVEDVVHRVEDASNAASEASERHDRGRSDSAHSGHGGMLSNIADRAGRMADRLVHRGKDAQGTL